MPQGFGARRLRALMVAVVALPLAAATTLGAGVEAASATEVHVGTTAELRDAIIASNTLPGEHTIVLGGNITIDAALPAITAPVTIQGVSTVIDFGPYPGFEVTGPDVHIRELTVSGGTGPVIHSTGERLTLFGLFIEEIDGVGISIQGGSVNMSRMFIFGTTGLALDVAVSAGESRIHDVTIGGNTIIPGVHVSASGSASLALEDARISSMSQPVVVDAADDAAVTVAGLAVWGASGDDAVVRSSSSIPVQVVGVNITQGPHSGLTLDAGSDGAIEAMDLEIRETGGPGLIATTTGGRVSVTGASVLDGVTDGVSVDAAGGTVTLSGLTTVANPGAGLTIAATADDSLVTVDQSQFAGSSAGIAVGVSNATPGGGEAPAVTVTRSTIWQTGLGVDAEVTAGSLTFVNSTITGNGSATPTGALWLGGSAAGSVELLLTTVSGNWGTTSIGAFGPTLDIRSSIIADNGVSAEDIGAFGSTVQIDHSMIGKIISAGVQVAFDDGVGNLMGDPQLGALGDNGGPTDTMLPAATSPVIDAGGTLADPPPTDQRLAGRVVSGTVDMGAVEVGRVLAATGTDIHGVTGALTALAALLVLAGLAIAAATRRRERAQTPPASR